MFSIKPKALYLCNYKRKTETIVNRLFFYFLLLLFFTSCSRSYKITGTSSVRSLDGKMLYIKTLQDGNWQTLDSAEVIHGAFTMKGKVDSVMMVTLYLDNEVIMPMVLEKGNIDLSISNTQLSARGTPLNNAFFDFIDKKNELDIRVEELERKEARMVMDGADLADIHEQLTKEGNELVEEMNNYVKKFISDNYENVLGPGVFMMMCSNLPYPILTPQLEEVLKEAPASFKNNKMVKEFVTKAKENKQLIEEHQRMQQRAPGSN